jgi:hypothetical protein
MNLNISCGEKKFTASFSYWYSIRNNIIKASINYIEDKIKRDNEMYENLKEDEINYIGNGSYYNYYMNIITDLIYEINEENKNKTKLLGIKIDNTIKIFMKLSCELRILNALNYFGLGGLFALCNQSDCEGYYTPGNSLDVCALLIRIKPFMNNYEGYSCLYSPEQVGYSNIYSIFEESHKRLKNVSIS